MGPLLLALIALTPSHASLSSTDGTIHLAWDGGTAEAYDLEHVFEGETTINRAGTPDFHLSGLRSGEHRYRLRAIGTDTWSEPISVVVTFPGGTLVVTLLLVGGALLLSTAFAVFRGAGEGA